MEKAQKQRLFVRALTVTGIMSAISFVLMLLDFSVPLVPHFLKFDFSDLPALLTSFAFGPLWGIGACLIKNLLHLFFTSSMGIGELSNFLLGTAFVGTAGLVYRFVKGRKGAVIASVLGAAACAVLSLFSNFFIIYPMYITVLNLSEEKIVGMYENLLPGANLFALLAAFNVPFTFVKCVAVALIVFFIYKPLSPILKGKKRKKSVETETDENTNESENKE